MLINKPLKKFLKSLFIFAVVMSGIKYYTMYVGEPVIDSSAHFFIKLLLIPIPYTIFLFLMLYAIVGLVVDVFILLGFLSKENLESFDFNNKGNDKNEWNIKLCISLFNGDYYFL